MRWFTEDCPKRTGHRGLVGIDESVGSLKAVLSGTTDTNADSGTRFGRRWSSRLTLEVDRS